MIAAGRLAAAVAWLLLPRPPPAAPLSVALPATMADVIAGVLAPAGTSKPPVVLGVGELHQTADTAGIASSIARFTRELWPLLAGEGSSSGAASGARVSDLIVETWVTAGACGTAEAATVEDVARTTERPAATENEIVALLARAKGSGARPHILTVTCDEYELLAPRAGAASKARRPVDFERMLALIKRKLEAKVNEVLAARPPGDAEKLVVVYGGALHNDLHPDPALAPFSYGVPAFRATLGRYRELDLYVPEYLERAPAMRGEPWFPLWQQAARPGQIVVIRRSPDSVILVFAKTKK
jgi:hypothetical protein